jgi:hypothetical protein
MRRSTTGIDAGGSSTRNGTVMKLLLLAALSLVAEG